MYRSLDPSHIVKTIERLQQRIDTRFPGAGLGRVCGELLATAHKSSAQAAKLAQRNWPLRISVGAILALGLAAQIAAAKFLHLERFEASIGLLESLEAAVNLLILFGGAAWFLLTLEERLKRQRALDALHELRSLAHVIDMHQLTKDPEWLSARGEGSLLLPPRRMTRFELSRYLDYCTEALSLTAKLAALYIQGFDDDVALAAVDEIESLTNGLSRKIWQKLMILHAVGPGQAS